MSVFLGGKSHGRVAFGNRIFLVGNHISDEQWDKEQESQIKAKEHERIIIIIIIPYLYT